MRLYVYFKSKSVSVNLFFKTKKMKLKKYASSWYPSWDVYICKCSLNFWADWNSILYAGHIFESFDSNGIRNIHVISSC